MQQQMSESTHVPETRFRAFSRCVAQDSNIQGSESEQCTSFYPITCRICTQFYQWNMWYFATLIVWGGGEGTTHANRALVALGRGISFYPSLPILFNDINQGDLIYSAIHRQAWGGLGTTHANRALVALGRGISKSFDTPQPPLIGSPTLWIKLAWLAYIFCSMFLQNIYWQDEALLLYWSPVRSQGVCAFQKMGL